MAATLDLTARERAYTALCAAVTAAGRENESLFLARLVLLLGERLGDGSTFEHCIAEASLANKLATRGPPVTDRREGERVKRAAPAGNSRPASSCAPPAA